MDRRAQYIPTKRINEQTTERKIKSAKHQSQCQIEIYNTKKRH